MNFVKNPEALALIRELDLVLPSEYEAHKKACAKVLFELHRDEANRFASLYRSSAYFRSLVSERMQQLHFTRLDYVTPTAVKIHSFYQLELI